MSGPLQQHYGRMRADVNFQDVCGDWRRIDDYLQATPLFCYCEFDAYGASADHLRGNFAHACTHLHVQNGSRPDFATRF